MGLEAIANQIEQNQERIAAGESIARAAHQPAIVQYVSAQEMNKGYTLLDEIKATFKRNLDGKAYGDDSATVPNPFPGDSCFDYFDGGVYKWGAPDFPKDRFHFHKSLRETDGEITPALRNNEFYNFIGKYILPKYNSGEFEKNIFDDNNCNEIVVSFKINGDYYAGFKKIGPTELRLIQSFNKK